MAGTMVPRNLGAQRQGQTGCSLFQFVPGPNCAPPSSEEQAAGPARGPGGGEVCPGLPAGTSRPAQEPSIPASPPPSRDVLSKTPDGGAGQSQTRKAQLRKAGEGQTASISFGFSQLGLQLFSEVRARVREVVTYCPMVPDLDLSTNRYTKTKKTQITEIQTIDRKANKQLTKTRRTKQKNKYAQRDFSNKPKVQNQTGKLELRPTDARIQWTRAEP